jgi:hypothetical protein
LDITNNALVINYIGETPTRSIREQIRSGRNGEGVFGHWSGSGVVSSTAAKLNSATPNLYSVGYADNGRLPEGAYDVFRGQPVGTHSLLIAFTPTSDANLDGVVDDHDVTVASASYASTGTYSGWSAGDFDYDGSVDNDDLTLLGALYSRAFPVIAEVPLSTEGGDVDVSRLLMPNVPGINNGLTSRATDVLHGETAWKTVMLIDPEVLQDEEVYHTLATASGERWFVEQHDYARELSPQQQQALMETVWGGL